MSDYKKRYQYNKNECDDSKIRRTCDDVKKINPDDEEKSLREYDSEVDSALSSRMLSNVHYQIRAQQSRRRRKAIRIVRVACVFCLLAGVWWFTKPHDPLPSTSAFTENKTVITNRSDTIELLNLPDHSVVYLMPRSHLSYTGSFNVNQRNIYLDGEAIFSVSKNPDKPFNVFTGEIVTTAIGTEFKIHVTEKNIFIKLLEGKIDVRKAYNASDHHFLVAGHSINYNIESRYFTSILHTAKRNTPQSSVKTQKTVLPNVQKTVILNNEPLSDALDQIAQQYNVEIEYSPADIENINIIASLDPSKPVYNVLHSIALMNHLRVLEIEDKQYIIDKVK